jgi:hypothetical protein
MAMRGLLKRQPETDSPGFESPTVPRSMRVQVLQPDTKIQLSPDRPTKK